MKLEEYESRIQVFARRFGRNFSDIQDFEQIGRFTVWSILSKNPNANKGYVINSIKYSMIGEYKRANAKKRNPSGKRIYSLEYRANEEGPNLGETLGELDTQVSKTEIVDFAKDELKKRYGGWYVKRLKEKKGEEKVKRFLRRVIEEVYEISPNELSTELDGYFFKENGLKQLINQFFKGSIFVALSEIYGKDFCKWTFSRKPNGFWMGKKGYNNGKEAVKWFADINNIRNPRDCKKLGYSEFTRQGLGGMLQICFNDSPYLAFKTLFTELKPWESRRVPRGYFASEENQRNAVIEYFMSKGVQSIESIDSEETYAELLGRGVGRDDFDSFGLSSIRTRHGGSFYETLKDLFPDKILPWTFNSKENWKKDPKKTAAKAIRWLFDDYLEIPGEEIPRVALQDIFWNAGFSGIMTNPNIGYNSSPFSAVSSAYKGVYSREDFTRKNRALEPVKIRT